MARWMIWTATGAGLLAVGLGLSASPTARAGGSTGIVPNEHEAEARADFYRGNYAAAEEQYRRMLAKAPQDQAVARDLAAVLAAQGQYREAAEVLRYSRIRGLELGEALMAAGDYPEATRVLKENLRVAGPHSHAWTLLGFLGSLQTRYAEAVQYYWKALDENPRQASVRLWLARAFEAMSNTTTAERSYFTQRARQEFLAALRADYSLWQVHRGLALLAEREAEWDEALQRWLRVKSVLGETEEVREALARVRAHKPAPTAVPTPAHPAIVGRPASPRIKEMTVTPLGLPGEPVIQVGLGKNMPSVAFACVGEWRAFDKQGRRVWKGQEKTGYRIEQHTGGGWVLKSWDRRLLKHFNKPITIEPLDPRKVLLVFDLYQTDGYSWSNGWRATRYYRGQLHVVPNRRRLTLINRVFLEDYLVGLLPGEMDKSWPMEALKAQAVVARTDVLGRRGAHRRDGYDVCTSAHCAYYQGVAAEDPRTQEAVLATREEVLMRKDKLVPAFYTHACGGMMQSYTEAWYPDACNPEAPGGIYDARGNTASVRSLPLRPGEIAGWLALRPEVFCGNPQYAGEHSYRWFKLLTREEFATHLDRKYGIGALRDMRVLERSPAAYVRKLRIVGSQGSSVLQGDAIRSVLGLRSNLFMFIPMPGPGEGESDPVAWLIWGGGWGHGVGLCQAGAAEMGRQGYLYSEILHHYFPEAEIQTWR